MNMDALDKTYGEDHEGGCEHEDRAVVSINGEAVLQCWSCGYVFPEDDA